MTEEYNVKPKQAQFLKDLEKLIDKTIPQVEEINSDTFGFKVEGDNIVGLSLIKQNLKKLPYSILHLSHLTLKSLNIFNYYQLLSLPEDTRNLYEGIKLYALLKPEQAEALKDFNILIGRPIQRADKIGYNSVGVKIFKSNIEELGLGSCRITTLPESISNLESLKKLRLENNMLTTLPESIGNLTSLKEINLEGNKLTTLPESFCQLRNLNWVYLKENNWKGEWQEMARFSGYLSTDNISTMMKLCYKLNGIDIFISHAMIDQEDYPIIKLNNNLEKVDIIHNVHLCEEDLRDSIQAFMDKNVPKCQLLIFVCTQNSLTSKDCLYELSLAKKFGITILPIKGNDISREDLMQVDLREHEQDFIDLNKSEGFEFNKKVFDKLQEYIMSHESELKLFKKEQEILDKEKSNMRKNVMDFADSNEFKEHLKENFEEFQKISQEVRNARITNFEYYWKLGQILNKRKDV